MVSVLYEENSVQIIGNVKNIDDYAIVKNALMNMLDSGKQSFEVQFVDSSSITSSVIGFMLKLINVDKAELKIAAGDKKLFELLDELELKEVFKLREL